jgi:hypothetical protein
MLNKAGINTLFGAKGLTLSHMYSKACELLEKKEDLFIDFGSCAEQIDSVMYDPYSKRVTFFYYFGEDHRSITLFESDKPTFRYNSVFGMYSLVRANRKAVTRDKESFTVLNLNGFFEHCEATLACGNKIPILYEGEVGEVSSIHRNLDTGELDLRFSNYPTFSHTSIILKPAGDWEFTRKYPGLGQASRDPWVVKQKAPLNNDTFGKAFLKEVDLELKKFGSQARVRIGDDSYHFVKAAVNTAANRMTVYLSSNLGRAQAFVFPMSMKWTFDKKFSAWVPDYVEDVIFIQQDIITELDMTCGDATYLVSGIQMKYIDSAMVGILKRAVFRFMNKHGDIETFCSTSDTRLRVLKMGDETQLHLEHAKKMKLD